MLKRQATRLSGTLEFGLFTEDTAMPLGMLVVLIWVLL
jgi:hypothetical protein